MNILKIFLIFPFLCISNFYNDLSYYEDRKVSLYINLDPDVELFNKKEEISKSFLIYIENLHELLWNTKEDTIRTFILNSNNDIEFGVGLSNVKLQSKDRIIIYILGRNNQDEYISEKTIYYCSNYHFLNDRFYHIHVPIHKNSNPKIALPKPVKPIPNLVLKNIHISDTVVFLKSNFEIPNIDIITSSNETPIHLIQDKSFFIMEKDENVFLVRILAYGKIVKLYQNNQL